MPTWSVERKEFIRICQKALRMNMQVSTGGNLSMKLDENLLLVKPSGCSLYDLHEEALLVTDGAGRLIEGTGKPTKEINTHLSVYRVRKDAGGVVHYHCPYATAYAVSQKPLPLMTVHARRILGKVPLIPPGAEGSPELALNVEKIFSDASVCAALLAGHGIMTCGKTLAGAQNMAELVEESARIALLSRMLSQGHHCVPEQ